MLYDTILKQCQKRDLYDIAKQLIRAHKGTRQAIDKAQFDGFVQSWLQDNLKARIKQRKMLLDQTVLAYLRLQQFKFGGKPKVTKEVLESFLHSRGVTTKSNALRDQLLDQTLDQMEKDVALTN